MSLWRNVRKYVSYSFERQSFRPPHEAAGPSAQALSTAMQLRGGERRAALLIHGIMPRSGTVYIGELLRLHPDLVAYPNTVWETPFLARTQDILAMQRRFFLDYEQNVGKLGERDFLPLFGSALIAHLYSFVPEGKRMLLKVPSVQYLSYFFSVFPHENLLLLVRDGRDLVESTLRTWPQLRFAMVCLRWSRAARLVLAFHTCQGAARQGYWLARFEDAVRDPVSFVREACRRFELDEARFPYDQIEAIPVQGSSSLQKRGSVVWEPTLKPEGFDPIGHWRTWSAARKRLFKLIAGGPLAQLGYCEDQRW
jgi:protein-tyrosine sulfotransferase